MTAPKFLAGVDVGSTTVKAILLDAQCDEIVWKDYRRHETRQVEILLDFLCRMEAGTVRPSPHPLPCPPPLPCQTGRSGGIYSLVNDSRSRLRNKVIRYTPRPLPNIRKQDNLS